MKKISAMDTLITPGDRKVAEALAARDLTFYNEQAGKDYAQIFAALSCHIPSMQYNAYQKIASQIYRSHKKGKEFKDACQVKESNSISSFQIFTVSLSPDAPTYVDWNLVKNALRKHILAEMKSIEKRHKDIPISDCLLSESRQNKKVKSLDV